MMWHLFGLSKTKLGLEMVHEPFVEECAFLVAHRPEVEARLEVTG